MASCGRLSTGLPPMSRPRAKGADAIGAQNAILPHNFSQRLIRIETRSPR
jgi:hypothetical protein